MIFYFGKSEPPFGPGISIPLFDITNIARMARQITTVVPITDFSVDFHDGLKNAGAIVLSNAVQTVNE